jgi:hypothetical protein
MSSKYLFFSILIIVFHIILLALMALKWTRAVLTRLVLPAPGQVK